MLTEEQKRERHREAVKRSRLKKTEETTPIEEVDVIPNTNWKKLYEEKCAEFTALTNKYAELEKICKSFVEKEKATENTLQKATLEYTARTRYLLDCVKHAYMSMQFAVSAADTKKGDNND